MENRLSSLLEKLYGMLEDAQSPLCNILQKGVSRKMIDERIQDLGINFLPEMYELYEWRNGVREEDLKSKTLREFWLFSMGFFPPLNFAISKQSI